MSFDVKEAWRRIQGMPQFQIAPVIKRLWHDPVWSKVIATGITAGVTALIGLVWYLWGDLDVNYANKQNAAEPLTLESLFEGAFPDIINSDFKYDLHAKNTSTNLNTIVPIRFRLYRDFTSHSEFLSIYLPLFHDARLPIYDIILRLRDQAIAIREQMHSDHIIDFGQPGASYEESTDLVFSGRVFLYTLNPLNPVQIGELVKWYEQKGLYLEIRGMDYWTFHNSTAK
jgi:hypothetical protein